MALRVEQIKFRVCDVCGSEVAVCRFRVSKLEAEPRTITVDLCQEHAAPMELVLAARPVPRRRARAVTPMKEVTALKRKATRKPRG